MHLNLKREMDPSDVVAEDDQFFGSGGYWMLRSQPMNCLTPLSRIADISFDPREELVWCVSSSVSLLRNPLTLVHLGPTHKFLRQHPGAVYDYTDYPFARRSNRHPCRRVRPQNCHPLTSIH